MKKFVSLSLLCISLTACSGHSNMNITNEWVMDRVTKPGVKSYDPPNGDWIFIANEPNGAMRSLKRNQNWTWEYGAKTGIAPQY